MKEKPIFEQVLIRLIQQPHFRLKLLIGAGLCFIPVVNLFAFGYLYRFSAQLRRTGQLRLPEWHDWSGLFIDGVKFTLVWLVYWLLPLVLTGALSLVLLAWGLGALAYLLMSAMFALVSMLFCTALYRLQMRSEYADLLDLPLIAGMTYQKRIDFLVPVLVFGGICVFMLPIYGFALFGGLLLLLAQTNLCYRSLESSK